MSFNSPTLKKAIQVAKDMGFTVTGFEITPEGGFRISTAQEVGNAADDALAHWARAQRGKDHN